MWNSHPPLSLLETVGEAGLLHLPLHGGVLRASVCTYVLGLSRVCMCVCGQSVYICLVHACVCGVCMCVCVHVCSSAVCLVDVCLCIWLCLGCVCLCISACLCHGC